VQTGIAFRCMDLLICSCKFPTWEGTTANAALRKRSIARERTSAFLLAEGTRRVVRAAQSDSSKPLGCLIVPDQPAIIVGAVPPMVRPIGLKGLHDRVDGIRQLVSLRAHLFRWLMEDCCC